MSVRGGGRAAAALPVNTYRKNNECSEKQDLVDFLAFFNCCHERVVLAGATLFRSARSIPVFSVH